MASRKWRLLCMENLVPWISRQTASMVDVYCAINEFSTIPARWNTEGMNPWIDSPVLLVRLGCGCWIPSLPGPRTRYLPASGSRTWWRLIGPYSRCLQWPSVPWCLPAGTSGSLPVPGNISKVEDRDYIDMRGRFMSSSNLQSPSSSPSSSSPSSSSPSSSSPSSSSPSSSSSLSSSLVYYKMSGSRQ